MINVQRAAERAHVIFEDQGWEWASKGVPTVEDIKECIEYLGDCLEDIPVGQPGEDAYCSTGRIRVQRDHFEDTGLEYSVLLILGDDFDSEDIFS